MTPLYKFVGSKEAVCAIARGSIKFTRIDELNDPSELVPLMNRDAVRESLANVRRNGYSDEQFMWLRRQGTVLQLLSPETLIIPAPTTKDQANRILNFPVYDNLRFMEQQVLKTIKLIRSRVGIFSLTERYDSLPMWAHYAAQAKGYVVRFNGLDKEYPGDETGSLNDLKPVKYVEDLVGLTHDPSTQDNLFFCKLQDWSYEREWRVVSALSACQVDAGGVMHLRCINRKSVSGVICGWKVPAEEFSSIKAELRAINPELEVTTASLARGRVVLTDTT